MQDKIFKKLGTTLELFSYGVSPDKISSKAIECYNNADKSTKSDLIDHVYTKLAASFADLLRVTSSHDYAPEILVLTKVASSDTGQWNDYYQNIINTCVNASIASMDGMLKHASNLVIGGVAKAIPGVVGGLPGIALAAIPIIGALLSGSAYFAEKGVNEDSTDVEKQKAKNIAYRTLAADVVRRLRDEGLSIGPEEDYES